MKKNDQISFDQVWLKNMIISVDDWRAQGLMTEEDAEKFINREIEKHAQGIDQGGEVL
jgi:hypothetical protein